jgi:ribosomal protein L1
MTKISKKRKASLAKIDKNRVYSLQEASQLVKEIT